MAITIKELLASDTISQAADKVNFNFDQLLLNGGGPAGPQGPQGPPGPVGGRGIRGSQWYEGAADPNTVIFPDLEENDSYLQSNGDVWEYNGTAWVNTGINLEGPAGPAGASIWGETGNPTVGGQQITYPTTYTGDLVRSVLVGAVPTTDVVINPQFHASIPITNALNITNTVMAIQVPSAAQAAVRFMGSLAAGADYTQDIFSAQRIDLFDGDMLRFEDQKVPTQPVQTLGYYFRTAERGFQFDIGQGFLVNSGLGVDPLNPVAQTSDITLRVAANPPTSTGPGEIFFQNAAGPQNAGLKVGTTDTTFSGAPLTGNIWGEATDWRLNAQDLYRVDSSGGGVAIEWNATNGSILGQAQQAITYIATNQAFTATGGTNVNLTAGDDILGTAGDRIILEAPDLIHLSTAPGGGNPGLIWAEPNIQGMVVSTEGTLAAPAGTKATLSVAGTGTGRANMVIGNEHYIAGGWWDSGLVNRRNSLVVQNRLCIGESNQLNSLSNFHLQINNQVGTDNFQGMMSQYITSDLSGGTKGSQTYNKLYIEPGGAGVGPNFGYTYFTGFEIDMDGVDNNGGTGSASGARHGFKYFYEDDNRQGGGARANIGFMSDQRTDYLGGNNTRNIGFYSYNGAGPSAVSPGAYYGIYADNDIGPFENVPNYSGNWLKTGIQVGYGLNAYGSNWNKFNTIASPHLGDDDAPFHACSLILMPRGAQYDEDAKDTYGINGYAGGIGMAFMTSLGTGFYSPSVNRAFGPGTHRTGMLLWSSDMNSTGSGINDEFYNFCIGPHAISSGGSTTLGQNWKGQVRVHQGGLDSTEPGGGTPNGGAGQAFSVFGYNSQTYAMTAYHDKSDGYGLYVKANDGSGGSQTVARIQHAGTGNYVNFAGSSNWTYSSDRRLKTDIKDTDAKDGLEGILKLKPKWYKWKNDKHDAMGPQLGFIAQDVIKVYPSLISTDNHLDVDGDGELDETYSLDYAGLVVPLTQAVQELSKENKELKARLEAIEKKLGI